jgi:PAS domain S-box-containing protein
MARPTVTPTGRESPFGKEEIIVSKTDLKGRITYANDVFLRVARLSESEAIGQPHNIIRHPDMPHSVYKLMWQTIQEGDELFAYVVNLATNGDHYWVFAHVTPSIGDDGRIRGYHSNRRKPEPRQIDAIQPLYRDLRRIEQNAERLKDGMDAALRHLEEHLKARGLSYADFVFAV